MSAVAFISTVVPSAETEISFASKGLRISTEDSLNLMLTLLLAIISSFVKIILSIALNAKFGVEKRSFRCICRLPPLVFSESILAVASENMISLPLNIFIVF